MKFKAHPTSYRGVAFRSRLEARWAAFFDLAGWRWQYEPCDLGGWSPDFVLAGKSAPVLVEVKPINWSGDFDKMRAETEARDDLAKVRQASEDEVLILGAYPALGAGYAGGYGEHALGVFQNESWGNRDIAVLDQGYGFPLDFAAELGSFQHRMSGEYDGDHHLRGVDLDVVQRMWGRANALTQWRGQHAQSH